MRISSTLKKSIFWFIITFIIFNLLLVIFNFYTFNDASNYKDRMFLSKYYHDNKDLINDYVNGIKKSCVYYNQCSIKDIHNIIKKNYQYSTKYDCKFYSFVWYFFAREKGLIPQLVYLQNHVFVVAFNSTDYLILDQQIMEDIKLKNGQ